MSGFGDPRFNPGLREFVDQNEITFLFKFLYYLRYIFFLFLFLFKFQKELNHQLFYPEHVIHSLCLTFYCCCGPFFVMYTFFVHANTKGIFSVVRQSLLFIPSKKVGSIGLNNFITF